MLFNYFLDILKRDFYSDRKAANGLDKRKRKKTSRFFSFYIDQMCTKNKNSFLLDCHLDDNDIMIFY